MEFLYGQGQYAEGEVVCEGQIVLNEHKLFIRGDTGDLTQSYIPLEKIERLKKVAKGLKLDVRPTLTLKYHPVISGHPLKIKELINDLVNARGLRKKFLRSEWVDETH